MYEPRQGLVIWFHNLKHIRQLRTYGHLLYVSKKMKYAILYCNQREADHVSESIKRLSFVTDVEFSKWPQLDMNFQKEGREPGTTRRRRTDKVHA